MFLSLPKHNHQKNPMPNYLRLIRFRLFMFALLILLMVVSLTTDFLLGPSGLSLSTLWNVLWHPETVSPSHYAIVWDIRLPYALMAILVGMSLGLAGAEMQTVLNNPLASPFTLGISSAAAFGAALAIILGVSIKGISPQWIISINAFLFAIGAALLLDFMTRFARVNSSGIVLFGIALVYTFNALVAVMQFIATEDTLQGLIFWTMGNLSRVNAGWGKIYILLALFIMIFIWSMKSTWQLTALRLGEDRAISFGVNVKKLRLMSLIRISLLAATSVAFVGPIGFIGLVSPHIARIIFGEDHRFYLIGSALLGGLILSLASIASRNIMHGVIIPIGIVTSLVGVPFFLSIVIKNRSRL